MTPHFASALSFSPWLKNYMCVGAQGLDDWPLEMPLEPLILAAIELSQHSLVTDCCACFLLCCGI
jgi:hypothetical protein